MSEMTYDTAMKKTKYTIKSEAVVVDGVTKWRGAFEKREAAPNGFTSITQHLETFFDTEEEADQEAYAFLLKMDAKKEEIFKDQQ